MLMAKKVGYDPAQVVMDKVGMKNGIVPGYEIFGNRLLLGVYARPNKTAGGIELPDTVLDDQKNQGKSCLVLAVGPSAFHSDSNYDFKGQKVEVGDWVSIWVYETRPIKINGYECRIARDTDIQMKIPTPDSVF